MKKIAALLFCITLLASCSKEEPKPEVQKETPKEEVQVKVELPNVTGVWEGLYNEKYPINLVIYEQDDNKIIGKSAIEYKSRTAVAELTGSLDERTVTLKEPLDDKSGGAFEAVFSDDGTELSGVWKRFSDGGTKSFVVRKSNYTDAIHTDINEFWNDFKTAAGDKDIDKIASLVRIPFYTSMRGGGDDEDTETYYTLKAFKNYFQERFFDYPEFQENLKSKNLQKELESGTLQIDDVTYFKIQKVNGKYKLVAIDYLF